MEIYLDNSATTKVCDGAYKAIIKALEINYGNPSSVHTQGIAAAGCLQNAREQVSKALGCSSEDLYFSGSGTMANNAAILGTAEALKHRGNKIIISNIEHPSVNETVKHLENKGFEVIRLQNGSDGSFAKGHLEEAVDGKTILISVMLVNNETGVINPVEYISSVVKRTGAPAYIHCDAVQALGKLPLKPSALGVDLLTVSSHKIHGPKGAGALYIRKSLKLSPIFFGGGHEKGFFPGTEAVPAIAGFGGAAAGIPPCEMQLEKTVALRDRLLRQLEGIPDIYNNSPPEGLPYITNISVTGVKSEPLINYLSGNGIYISSGSACKKGKRSDVLTALGLPPERIDCAARISLSRYNTEGDIDILCDNIWGAVKKFRR
ncbi:MAG: cysteine desulfurase [Oscillospiraceae bacterium]|nr:cysteine desulfurase [Oscillospiraceae bacterium]